MSRRRMLGRSAVVAGAIVASAVLVSALSGLAAPASAGSQGQSAALPNLGPHPKACAWNAPN
ncbi:MAG TPA: hypothetical protein VMV08_06100 [Gaiellaceae bacterium]|nr:hypothetical protein [Gaiellaceae bacterium]